MAGLVFEDIVIKYLESQGFEILRRRHRIFLHGVEVGEVDIVAEKGGEIYAIEVKAGRADITAVRQAYVNAELLNAKPMLVCRGLANDEARELAKRLGVEVLELPDYALVTLEELEKLVQAAIEGLVQRLVSAVDLALSNRAVVDAAIACGDVQCFCNRVDCPSSLKLLRDVLNVGSYAEARRLLIIAEKVIKLLKWLLQRR